jgi:hypothetical protein
MKKKNPAPKKKNEFEDLENFNQKRLENYYEQVKRENKNKKYYNLKDI